MQIGIAMDGIDNISVSLIRTNGGTQPRQKLDESVVEEYRAAMRAGAMFPPVIVFFDGTVYWLADGFHRIAANESGEISCDVRQGTQQDAVWFSYSANKSNGLHRTNADKERSVKSAIAHPNSTGLSDVEIANHVGVDHKTVSKHRKSILGNSQDAPRTVTRNGSTYQMDVSKIGKSSVSQDASVENEPFGAIPETISAPQVVVSSTIAETVIETPAPPKPPEDPFAEYHDELHQIAEVFDVAVDRMIALATKAPGNIMAFTGWIQPNQWRAWLSTIRNDFKNHHVVGFATKAESAKLEGGRNFFFFKDKLGKKGKK